MTLIERLEKAGEGSRELDVAVYAHVEGIAETLAELRWQAFAPVTTSLDAALALAERTGLRPYMADATIKGRWRWTLENPALLGDLEAEPWTNGVSATPALALCLAVLRATQEQPDV